MSYALLANWIVIVISYNTSGNQGEKRGKRMKEKNVSIMATVVLVLRLISFVILVGAMAFPNMIYARYNMAEDITNVRVFLLSQTTSTVVALAVAACLFLLSKSEDKVAVKKKMSIVVAIQLATSVFLVLGSIFDAYFMNIRGSQYVQAYSLVSKAVGNMQFLFNWLGAFLFWICAGILLTTNDECDDIRNRKLFGVTVNKMVTAIVALETVRVAIAVLAVVFQKWVLRIMMLPGNNEEFMIGILSPSTVIELIIPLICAIVLVLQMKKEWTSTSVIIAIILLVMLSLLSLIILPLISWIEAEWYFGRLGSGEKIARVYSMRSFVQLANGAFGIVGNGLFIMVLGALLVGKKDKRDELVA